MKRHSVFSPDFTETICAWGWIDRRLGVPKAQLRWRPMPSEERTLRTTIDYLYAHWKAVGLERVCPLRWTAAARERESPLIGDAEACAHPSGTTRMGTDASTSIVGPDLHCHAMPNLAVISASVFPTAGSANPTFTIMKLACLFADFFLAALGGRPPIVQTGTPQVHDGSGLIPVPARLRSKFK